MKTLDRYNPFTWYANRVQKNKLPAYYFIFVWIGLNLTIQRLGLEERILALDDQIFFIVFISYLLLTLFGLFFYGFCFSLWKTNPGKLIFGLVILFQILFLALAPSLLDFAFMSIGVVVFLIGYFWSRLKNKKLK